MDNTELFCHDLPTKPDMGIGRILVTGATGYIGGRLVPELTARGYNVRVMVRRSEPGHINRWPESEIVNADALEFDSLKNAMKGVHTAYYLIHSLLFGRQKLEAKEIQAAYNFQKAAEENGVKRIIYLGGLGDINTSLSPHLRSRMKIAEIFMSSEVPATILRAAIIIGSGSASYELIKNLVENFPFLLLPYWAKTECQPIGVRDVIKYLVGVLEIPNTAGNIYDIGGNDILSYEKMIKILADVLGKKLLLIPSPVSWIAFYAYLANLFTAVPGPIIWSLLHSIKNEVVCQNNDIKNILPFHPLSYKEAILRAMTRDEQDNIHTRWSDAYPPADSLAIKLHELDSPPRFYSYYSLYTEKQPSKLFHSVCLIGGKEGWFNSNWMWRLRGILDRILMGVGTARGRRNSSELRVNDVIDFWRVEDIRPDKRLLLRAEMKLPGRAWLEFVIDNGNDSNTLYVNAFYQAKGLIGIIYWYTFLPFHNIIFNDLIKHIEERA